MASKDERALAARAAAQAALAAAGQSVAPPAPRTAGLYAAAPAPLGLSEHTRSLLASSKALGALAGSGGGSSSASASTGASKSEWLQAPEGFYFHPPSGVAQWAKPAGAAPPAPLPSGWFAADSGGGAPYFYTAHFINARGEEGSLVTWERPSAPPNLGRL